MRIFKDVEDSLKTKIVLMGTHKKKAHREMKLDDNFNFIWVYMPTEYRDCLYLYEMQGAIKQMICQNEVNMEKFQDIKIVKNKICLVSLKYSKLLSDRIIGMDGINIK